MSIAIYSIVYTRSCRWNHLCMGIGKEKQKQFVKINAGTPCRKSYAYSANMKHSRAPLGNPQQYLVSTLPLSSVEE